jgi:hypothetical protein
MDDETETEPTEFDYPPVYRWPTPLRSTRKPHDLWRMAWRSAIVLSVVVCAALLFASWVNAAQPAGNTGIVPPYMKGSPVPPPAKALTQQQIVQEQKRCAHWQIIRSTKSPAKQTWRQRREFAAARKQYRAKCAKYLPSAK